MSADDEQDTFATLIASAAEAGTERALRNHDGEQLTAAVERLATACAEQRINPWKLYGASESAPLLGMAVRSLHNVPEAELPYTWTGPKRGKRAYFGIDLICYQARLDPVDAPRLLQEQREQFIAQAKRSPNVVERMTGTSGKTRVH